MTTRGWDVDAGDDSPTVGYVRRPVLGEWGDFAADSEPWWLEPERPVVKLPVIRTVDEERLKILRRHHGIRTPTRRSRPVHEPAAGLPTPQVVWWEPPRSADPPPPVRSYWDWEAGQWVDRW